MVKVFEEKGYKFYVFPRDHPPPHVHVRCPDGRQVKINLIDGSFLVLPPRGKKRQIQKLFRKHFEQLWESWEKYHHPEE
jgi:hypothetical protein